MMTAATMMTPASVESEVRAASAPLLLEVSGLSARYGKVPALTEAALSLRAGQIVTVIGPNGAGKSTLLNAMMGAMPAGAASGRIAFQGEDVSQMEVEERVARGLSLVPEA
jgi:branched-chain amino acid transport system ATP-binding protein